MQRDELRIDEYLRSELPLEDAERIAELLERSPEAREHADWLMRVENLAEQARMEPPEEVVHATEARLLALPDRLATEPGPSVPDVGRAGRRSDRALRIFRWNFLYSPALRVAATLLVGVLIGYGIWGTGLGRVSPESKAAGGGETRLRAPEPAEGTVLSAGESASPALLEDLEARVATLERNIEAAYFGRVEAAMLRFVMDSSEGSVATVSRQDTRDLLTLTANLKAEHKAGDDMRMARLLGQIESVLMEMDRLARERDLEGSRHVASLIREQGLLTTLQRLKVGVEE